MQVQNIHREAISLSNLTRGLNRFNLNCTFVASAVNIYFAGSLETDLAALSDYTIENLTVLEEPGVIFTYNKAATNSIAGTTMAGQMYLSYRYKSPKRVTGSHSFTFDYDPANTVANANIVLIFEFIQPGN